MKPKSRLNRKELIEAFESLRMGFRTAYDFLAKTKVDKISMKANHVFANNMVIKLGGEAVYISDTTERKKRK